LNINVDKKIKTPEKSDYKDIFILISKILTPEVKAKNERNARRNVKKKLSFFLNSAFADDPDAFVNTDEDTVVVICSLMAWPPCTIAIF
jgi:hypothetical protein